MFLIPQGDKLCLFAAVNLLVPWLPLSFQKATSSEVNGGCPNKTKFSGAAFRFAFCECQDERILYSEQYAAFCVENCTARGICSQIPVEGRQNTTWMPASA